MRKLGKLSLKQVIDFSGLSVYWPFRMPWTYEREADAFFFKGFYNLDLSGVLVSLKNQFLHQEICYIVKENSLLGLLSGLKTLHYLMRWTISG